MSSKGYIRLMAGAVLMLGLAVNLLGTGAASAQSITATNTAQLLIQGGGSAVPAGTVLAVQGSGYAADEQVSMWINVPDGTSVSSDSLGQINTQIAGTVIPLNTMPSTNAYG